MSQRRLHFINWPIRSKLAALFLLVVLIPALVAIGVLGAQRQHTILREQNEIRLAALGAAQVVQTRLALDTLRTAVEQLVLDPATYGQVEQYFERMEHSSEADETRQSAQQTIAGNIEAYLAAAPSLTRVRLYNTGGSLLIDAIKSGQHVTFYDLSPDQTPANGLIETGQVGPQTMVTSIYRDSSNSPAVDVIYTLRRTGETTDVRSGIGQIVFSQNLLWAEQETRLPDLYALLRAFPQSDPAAHLFLLDDSGRTVMPDDDHALLTDASRSTGFRRAQSGETRVSSYHSALLDTGVIGYHTVAAFPDGFRLTFLVETRLDDIRQQAVEEALMSLPWIALVLFILGMISTTVASHLIARPITQLITAGREVAGGQSNAPLPRLVRRDEVGALSHTFSDMAGQLLGAVRELENRVADRTHNVEAMLEVSRVLASIRDLDTLLDEVVNLIRDQFARIYHAQIFLIDPQTNRANLRASTGSPGRILLQRGHYLDIGSQSVIGSVTATGHAVVALDTSNHPIHRRNEFLPDTRAEMALPLRIGQRVIGALDLQSTQPDAFSEQDVEFFQGMADQVSVAIENTTLFDQSLARLAEIERLNRSLTEAAWHEVGERRGPQTLSASAGLVAPSGEWSALQLEAMRTQQIVERLEGDRVTVAVPVLLREQVMGAVEWQVPQSHYTAGARQTAQQLTDRLALAAENIRLYEQSLQAVQREQLVNQISSKLIGMTDIDQILQTAVRELGQALKTSQMLIQLKSSEPKGNSNGPADG